MRVIAAGYLCLASVQSPSSRQTPRVLRAGFNLFRTLLLTAVNSRRLASLYPCIALAMLLIPVANRSFAADAVASKPNIVFVLTDDMGTGDLGCYGGTIAPTPNI